MTAPSSLSTHVFVRIVATLSLRRHCVAVDEQSCWSNCDQCARAIVSLTACDQGGKCTSAPRDETTGGGKRVS